MLRACVAGGLLVLACGPALPAQSVGHVWEMHEIALRTTRPYTNPYRDVETWIELTGPDFAKRVYGFWDGGDVNRVRFVATAPGHWS